MSAQSFDVAQSGGLSGEPGRGGAECPSCTCEELLEVLYEYVDGGCDEQMRAVVSYHMQQCPECVEALGIEREVRALLRERCVQRAPQELRARISATLRVTYRSS